LSLIVYFQLEEKADKEVLLSKFDNALLDENAAAKLGELIIANTSVPM